MKSPLSRPAVWFLTLLVCLSGCQFPMTPGTTKAVMITFQTSSRTVVADWAAIVDHYSVTLTNASLGKTLSATGTSSVSFEDLESGTWTVGAVAVSHAGATVGAATQTVSITPDTGSIALTLATSQTGSGSFSFTFAVPDNLEVFTVTAELFRSGSSLGSLSLDTETGLAEVMIEGRAYLQGTFSQADFGTGGPSIASGTYFLKLGFFDGENRSLGVHGEAVNVWDNAASTVWLDGAGNLASRRIFRADELLSNSTGLAGASLTSGGASLISFSPETLDYQFPAPSGDFQFTPWQGSPGQTIQYSLDGGSTWVWTPSGFPVLLAFDPYGEVRVRVTAQSQTASRIYTFTAAPQATTFKNALSYDPVGITGDSSGNLYIVEPGGTLRKFSGASETILASGLNNPYGIAIDNAGNLYVTEYTGGNVLKRAPNGTITTIMTGLNCPSGIAVSGSGDLIYVADRQNGRIVRYQVSNSSLVQLMVGMLSPDSVALDASETNLYVGGNGDGAIYRFDLTNMDASVLWQSGDSFPYGVTVDPSGTVYVCLLGYQRILQIPAHGPARYILGSGSLGSIDGLGSSATLASPYQIYRSPSGTFYFTERSQYRIRSFQ